MAIFHPPVPPVFIGGAQPYAQRENVRSESAQLVNDPPFRYGGPIAVIASIIALTQPDPWQYNNVSGAVDGLQPYGPRQLNPSITAVPVNNPPFTIGGPVALKAEILSLAQPDPWTFNLASRQPFEGKKNSPAIPGQSVDNPPFADSERLGGTAENSIIETKAIWQPSPWVYSYLGGPLGAQPYGPGQLNPSQTHVTVNDPPFDAREAQRRAELIGLAQPSLWPFVYLGSGQPYGYPLLTPFRPDIPPFDDRTARQRAEIVAIWQPDPWVYSFFGSTQPFTPKYNSPGIPGQSVNDPPFDRRLSEQRSEVVALNQPPIWNYTFEGGKQPYAPTPLNPFIENVPPLVPGAGKRRDFPSYIAQAPYGQKKRKAVQPIWDRPEAPPLGEVPEVEGPPPLPPFALPQKQRTPTPPALLSNETMTPVATLRSSIQSARDNQDAQDILDALAAIEAIKGMT